MLKSSYFYSKDTDEFKSINVDKILTDSPGEKKNTDRCYLPHFAESEAGT